MDDNIGDVQRSAAETLREATSDAADKISGVATGAKENFEDIRQTVKEKVQDASDYVQNFDAKAVMDDVFGLVKQYPAASLAAALAVGFLLAFVVRRRA